MSRLPVSCIENVKKLLSCNRRQVSAGDDTSSCCSSVKSDVRESSSDSLLCQPRLTLEELRRRQMERHAEIDSRYEPKLFLCRQTTDEDTESQRTLCTGSFVVEDVELLVDSMMQPEISAEEEEKLARQACNSSAGDRQKSAKKPDNLAEICHLESCDDSCNVNEVGHEVFLVSNPGELTVTEYYPGESPAFDQKQKVCNNAPLCFQGQLKAEQCEISFRQGDNATVCSSEMGLQLTANLSDAAVSVLGMQTIVSSWPQFQSSCSNTNRQNACHWSALRVQLVPNESEPMNTCATMTASEDPRSHLTCWPTGDAACSTEADAQDADSATEIAIAQSVIDTGSVATTEAAGTREGGQYQLSLEPAETSGIIAQTNEHVGHLPSQLDLSHLPSLESNKDRFGIMSAELYHHLLEGTQGPDLMRRYLEKREVNESVRASHERRCGRISEKTVQAILKSSAEAAATDTGATAAPATTTQPTCGRPAPDPADAAVPVPAAARPSGLPKLGSGLLHVNFQPAQRKVRLVEDERQLISKSRWGHRKPRTA